MTKQLLIVLTILLFASSALGMQLFPGSTASGGADYSDIIFWWRAESGTMTDSLGNDHSAGDTTGASSGSPAYNAAAMKYGTNGLDSPDGQDWVTFVPNGSGDIASLLNMRLGFWLRVIDAVDDAQIIEVEYDGSNFVLVRIDGDSDPYGLTVLLKENGNFDVGVGDGGSYSYNTWYFIELKLDQDGDGCTLIANGAETSGVVNDAYDAPSNEPNGLEFANPTTNAADFHIDNVMISNDPTRDFYRGGTGLCDDTGSPL